MAAHGDLDAVFHVIMEHFVATGQAPHYTEIASALGMTPDEGRESLHALFATNGFPGWLHPKTDYIATFPPFSSLPNQHRITIDGEQKWFAQCGFESLAVCWLFPEKTVVIDTVCLDCGEPLQLRVKDGVVETGEAEALIGNVAVPFARWFFNLPFA